MDQLFVDINEVKEDLPLLILLLAVWQVLYQVLLKDPEYRFRTWIG